MKELNFNNVKLIYNESEINKKTILLNNCVLILSSLLTVVLMFLSMFIIPDNLLNTGLGLIVGIIIALTILFIGVCLTYFTLENKLPKHFDFVSWLIKLKQNDIEFGTFNGRYLIRVFTTDGWKTMSLERFINEKDLLIDSNNADYSKPLRLIVDCTNEQTKVYVCNQ